jgi:CheY-like chemotaxis protein
MDQPSLLIVDDEPDNFDVIEALLSVGKHTSGDVSFQEVFKHREGQEPKILIA